MNTRPADATLTPRFDVQALEFDKALIERLSTQGPRYTSYPTADRFHDQFTAADLQAQIALAFPAGQRRPLSLYVHIPFCNTVCYYCGCNKVVTNNKSHAERYLDYLDREIALQAPQFEGRAIVEQLHFGGGTPTFLSDAQLVRLVETLRSRFAFVPDDQGEYAIEIDPRKVSAATVALLAKLGFNRMSLGVQDFDPAVQIAVNRVQSEAETRNVIDAARRHGFRSISIDLIYGLPKQDVASFQTTLDKIIAIRPDRLSIYSYAHLPQHFKTQRQIDETTLPSPSAKLDILSNAIARLTDAGYVYIGMDHFALPDDELAQAQRAGTLHRNFQGYSTRDDIDLLALGVSAISKIGDSYSQNSRDLADYYRVLDSGKLPVMRGYVLNTDDTLRRSLIQHLMCDFRVDLAAITAGSGIPASRYFHAELPSLRMMADEGLLRLDSDVVTVLPKGRFFIRNIAMVFDLHLT